VASKLDALSTNYSMNGDRIYQVDMYTGAEVRHSRLRSLSYDSVNDHPLIITLTSAVEQAAVSNQLPSLRLLLDKVVPKPQINSQQVLALMAAKETRIGESIHAH